MPNTEITVIRHGETLWNVQRRYQGQLNSPLTDNGIRQAHAAGQLIKNKKFDYFISSDLERAVATAKIIGSYIGQSIDATSASIRERDFGIAQGLSRDELKAAHPKVLQGLIDNNPDFHLPKGESFADFYTRVATYFNTLAQTYKGRQLLVVTHGGVLNCLFRLVINLPLEVKRNYSIKNSGINIIQHNQQGWLLDTWGMTNDKNTYLANNMY